MKIHNCAIAVLAFAASLAATSACDRLQQAQSEKPKDTAQTTAPASSQDNTQVGTATETTQTPSQSSQSGSPSAAQGTEAGGRRGTLLFSSSLVGSRVKDSKGNDVGKIKDLLLDAENRRVVYAVVALANRDIAVPLNAVKMDPQTQNYTLDMTEDSLADAPRIGKDNKLPSELTEVPKPEDSTAPGKPSSKS